jgi:hypothetical protein
MKKLDWRDIAIRGVLLAAGSVAAVLLVMKGQAQAVPALAIGAVAGSLAMGRISTAEEE